jgi:hypothetical protein
MLISKIPLGQAPKQLKLKRKKMDLINFCPSKLFLINFWGQGYIFLNQHKILIFFSSLTFIKKKNYCLEGQY